MSDALARSTALPGCRCGSCSTAEKTFLTGEQLTVRGRVVCLQNDWNKVKQYYVQGIKGLLVVYNRETDVQWGRRYLRNVLLTLALVAIAVSVSALESEPEDEPCRRSPSAARYCFSLPHTRQRAHPRQACHR